MSHASGGLKAFPETGQVQKEGKPGLKGRDSSPTSAFDALNNSSRLKSLLCSEKSGPEKKDEVRQRADSILARRNVKSLPRLDCDEIVAAFPRPQRKSEPTRSNRPGQNHTIVVGSQSPQTPHRETYHQALKTPPGKPGARSTHSSSQSLVQDPVSSQSNLRTSCNGLQATNLKQDPEVKKKTLKDLNKDLGSIFQTTMGPIINPPVISLTPPKSKPPTPSRAVARRSDMEDLLELGDLPSRPHSRRSLQNEPISLPKGPSGERHHPPPPPEETTNVKAANKPARLSRGLYKSFSRTSVFEDPVVDELEVYHTISGGRSHLIAASRPAIPFAKITRRPARIVAGIPPMVDEDRDSVGNFESSLGLSEDVWRVSGV